MILVVTAFVPIPGHPRPEEEYHKLAAPLLEGLSNKVLVLSKTQPLKDCWLHWHLHETYGDPPDVTHSIADNPKKNTLDYHIVQANKTEFMAVAAEVAGMNGLEPDVFVWIDYGIFHVPGVTIDIILDFLRRAEDEQTIAIPGCWEKGQYTYSDDHPCWRFCGGLMVVPRKYLFAFDHIMKQEYCRLLRDRKHVSWEVNMLARIEQRGSGLPLWWYKADHDASMFTAYQPELHSRYVN